MKANITLDLREWRSAARALKETSSRTLVDFTNGQALAVASRAIQFTEKANRQQIEHIMGIMARKETLRGGEAGKKGWVRISGRKIKDDSFAERIVAKRFRTTGSWFGLTGKTLKQKAIQLVAAKVKSVGFIKSGWIPAVKKLSAIVYKKPLTLTGRVKGEKIIGKPKGFAIPAKFSLKSTIVAVIGNTALLTKGRLSTWHGKPGDPMPVAVKGLQEAVTFSAKDMIAELARRLRPDFKKVSAR